MGNKEEGGEQLKGTEAKKKEGRGGRNLEMAGACGSHLVEFSVKSFSF